MTVATTTTAQAKVQLAQQPAFVSAASMVGQTQFVLSDGTVLDESYDEESIANVLGIEYGG